MWKRWCIRRSKTQTDNISLRQKEWRFLDVTVLMVGVVGVERSKRLENTRGDTNPHIQFWRKKCVYTYVYKYIYIYMYKYVYIYMSYIYEYVLFMYKYVSKYQTILCTCI